MADERKLDPSEDETKGKDYLGQPKMGLIARLGTAGALGGITFLGTKAIFNGSLGTPGALLLGGVASLASFYALQRRYRNAYTSAGAIGGLDEIVVADLNRSEGGEAKRLPKVSWVTGSASECGRRTSMEDFYGVHPSLDCFSNIPFPVGFFGVYDGHGGSRTAEFVSRKLVEHLKNEADAIGSGDGENALRRAFTKTDAECIASLTPNGDKSGSTGATCLIVGNTLYVADIGDSEVLLVKDPPVDPAKANTQSRDDTLSTAATEATGTQAFEVLSKKHMASGAEEKQRLKEAGAIVFQNRLFGILMVSRAFGDAEFKGEKNFVLSDPHTHKRELQREDSILIIASDGLWDRVSYADAADYALRCRKVGIEAPEAALSLARLALTRGTIDNVTVVVVYLTVDD